MTAHIYQEDLEFLQEAKEAFEEDYRLVSYRNDDDSLIALRRGEDRDCIHIYRINEEVLFAHNVMEKAPGEVQPVLDTDAVKEYFEEMRDFSTNGEFKEGRMKALGELVGIRNTLSKLVND